MRDLETVLKAVADPGRTRILKLLEQGELCVCQIQAVLALAPSTVSKHLSILRNADLVEDRKEGRWIHYRLVAKSRNPYAGPVLAALRGKLDLEERIVEDRLRLKRVRAVPVETLCATPSSVRFDAPRRGARGASRA
jgi:DNA-binding transcriptional ArsR family regulator